MSSVLVSTLHTFLVCICVCKGRSREIKAHDDRISCLVPESIYANSLAVKRAKIEEYNAMFHIPRWSEGICTQYSMAWATCIHFIINVSLVTNILKINLQIDSVW